MSFELEIGVGRHCTLYSPGEYRARFPTGTPGKTGKAFIGSAVASDLARNKEQLSSLSNFLRDCRVASAAQDVAEPMRLLHGLQRAVTGGDVVAVVEPLRSIGVPGRSEERLRPRSITLTPSQLLGALPGPRSTDLHLFSRGASCLRRMESPSGLQIRGCAARWHDRHGARQCATVSVCAWRGCWRRDRDRIGQSRRNVRLRCHFRGMQRLRIARISEPVSWREAGRYSERCTQWGQGRAQST